MSTLHTDRKLDETDFADGRARDRRTMSAEDFERKYSNTKWYAITDQSYQFVKEWLKKNCKGRTALDFGCGFGGMSLQLARLGATVHAVDISAESVATTRKVLVDTGYHEVGHTYVMDGENLQFPDAMFDIIICSGVLHHVDVNAVFPELARVLKSNGTIIGLEALGYNPIINMYRRLTPSLRTAWEPDHILTNKELKIADRYFGERRVHYFYLFSILAVPLRRTGLFNPVRAALRTIDSVVLRIPGVRLLAWQMVFFLGRPHTHAPSDAPLGAGSGGLKQR